MADEEMTSTPACPSAAHQPAPSAPPPPPPGGDHSNHSALPTHLDDDGNSPANQAADSSVMGDDEDEEVDQLEDDEPTPRGGSYAGGAVLLRAQATTKDQDEIITKIDYTQDELAAFKVDETIPDDINPGAANLYTNAIGEKLFRNTPIKKNDGGTILRSDLQHALLLEIFDDTTRCFRNPRPAPQGSWIYPPRAGEAAATGVYEYSPVYPYGQSKGSTRRSNETPEEYAAWQKGYDEFWKNPYPTPNQDPERKVPRPGDRMLTFKELYMEALMNSPRCTKAVRDKIWQDEEYAQDFLCVNLLINIGRMNTTLAFFAQMQTILRCYHPLPSLQRCENSRKHMQDAPRMKSLLKSVLLPFEKASTGPGSAPASKAAQAANVDVAIPEADQIELAGTLEEVIQRYRDGRTPSTSVVNLIFLFQQEAHHLSNMHFNQPHDMFTIFFPHKDYPIPARQRARAFLWLVWHYLEGGAVLPPGNEAAAHNPFADEQAASSVRRARSKWDSLDPTQRRKCTLGSRGLLWLGVRNKNVPLRTAVVSNALDVPSKEGAGADTVALQPTSRAASPSPGPAPADILDTESNEPYTHRILAPAFETTTLEEIRKENIDLPNEIEWGRTQAHERRVFMVRAALEEKEKAEAEARGEPIPAHLGGKGKGKGKRRSRGGGGAAAASASSAAEEARARIKNRIKRKLEDEEAAASGGDKVRRISLSPSGVDDELLQTIGDFDEDEDGSTSHPYPPRGRRGSSLGSVSSTFREPGQTTMPNFRRRLAESDLSLFSAPPPPGGTSIDHPIRLTRLAWDRILQRAVRGQGDACYDSDDEEAALDESQRCGEMFAGELSRILACVWKEGKRIGTRPDAEAEGGEAQEKGQGEAYRVTEPRRRLVPDPYSRSIDLVSQ